MQDKVSTVGMLHHEDLEVGKPYPLGHKIVSKEEIISFARLYDPQPMHVDEEAAKTTLAAGLCASGWHTCAMMMRLVCEGILNKVASLGSPGVDEVRWRTPVRPGDRLSGHYLVEAKRDLASRPDVGVCKVRVELVREPGEVVAYWTTNQLSRRRHPGPAPKTDANRKRERQALVGLWDAQPVGDCRPRADAFYEDRQIGETTDLGSHTYGKDEIIAFAREFDPQPFHLDEAAAKVSLFGALCASGWHTAVIGIGKFSGARLRSNVKARAQGVTPPAYGPSPGFRNLTWPRPTFVGDTLEYRSRLVEKIDLKSRPDRGLIATNVQARNQKGEVVYSVITQILAERRSPYRPA